MCVAFLKRIILPCLIKRKEGRKKRWKKGKERKKKEERKEYITIT